MEKNNKFYAFIATVIVVSCCCSLVIGWVPIFGKTWIWTLTLSILSVFLYPKGLTSRFIFPLLVYGIVLYLNMYAGDQKFDFVTSTMEFFGFVAASYVFYIFSQSSYSKAAKILLFSYVVVIAITFLGTLFIYTDEPEVLRMIQEGLNNGDGRLYFLYARLGVGSYAMGHALPCLIPIIIYAIKKGGSIFRKSLLILLLLLNVLLVYMSTATTALLISAILIIVSLVWNEKTRTKNYIVLTICSLVAIAFLTNRELLGSVLDKINLDSETTYAGKIRDFQEYATYGSAGGQTQSRLNLYSQSLDMFLASPIIGIDDARIGGHSVFFDRAAMLGLVGLIPLVIFLYNYMRYVFRKISKSIRAYYLLGFMYFIVLGCLKNIFSFEYILITLLIMPLACLYVDRTFPSN